MSGRGHGRGQRGQGRGAGQGRQSPPSTNTRVDREPKFRGSNPDLPSLNYGASGKENKPIEFLQTMGEHVAINYKPSICYAFWSTPPAFGTEDEEPELPEDIPTGNQGKAILANYLSDHKDWKSDAKKILENKQAVFALVYAQLSESSRGEVKDDEEWAEAYITRDLLHLIVRIRATHIARQSGNPGQDRERVSQLWSTLRMQPHETSFAFRKRVEDHQLERAAVGLPVIPEDELVIGILNRLDMSRYASLTKDYFDNERRGIAELPDASSTLWKEIKDTQVIRFRGSGGGALESVYLTRADDIHIDGGRGRGRGGRSGGRRGGGRGGRGRGRGAPETLLEGKEGSILKGSSIAADTAATSEIECWTCHQKGHRSSTCPLKRVHFAALAEDETVFYTSVETLHSTSSTADATRNVFLTAAIPKDDTTILLDTQSSIHIIRSPAMAVNIHDTSFPVTIQGITGDRVRILQEATIKDIGIQGYYSPFMSANIISYHKLKETHSVQYDEETDTFTAVPPRGMTLIFTCVRGHYVMDIDDVVPIFVVKRSPNYTAKQLTNAREAYEFITRMGFVSFKSAAEIIQRGSMKDINFSRADLVNAQNIYGTPAAYQLGQGTQRNDKCREDDQIPLHESVSQELQVDLFFFLGQVFFLSISVLLGLVMVTHLGPGHEKPTSGTKATEGSRAKAGKALLHHLSQYTAKGFHVKTVTSDGEGSVKSVRSNIEELGVNLNILGHGSHAPHIESAIRHIKNKARSTLYSLPYPLPSRLAAALIAFVVHTANMVPKHNSPGHLPAYTAFRGRAPSYKVDAPHAFGTTGFLQKPLGTLSNTSAPRADYCLWLGTTRNLKGTHRCFNLSTLAEITGDTFRPAPLTNEAVQRLRQLAGSPVSENSTMIAPEEALVNPDEPYALDPKRGVIEDTVQVETEIVSTESILELEIPQDVLDPLEITSVPEVDEQVVDVTDVSHSVKDTKHDGISDSLEQAIVSEDIQSEVTQMRNALNTGYNLRQSTVIKHVYTALTIKSATSLYGEDIIKKAVTLELTHCISKGVFKGLKPSDSTQNAIPSKMFLTPKKLPSGAIDKMKARLVAGGHRQDRSLYTDEETSSPTASLTAVFAQAALAAHRGDSILTLDHKAAYLNAVMKGPVVKMILSKEVSTILCEISNEFKVYLRANGTILVQLEKALYGCIQSAVLWYDELSSTIGGLGYTKNPYDTCVYNKIRDGNIDSILVYVDDLLLTSQSQDELHRVADALRSRYGGVTVKSGTQHDFLGINWDFRVPGEVSLRMEGYVSNILSKYNVSKHAKTPATDMLFHSNKDSPIISHEKQQLFHSCVMELHYLAKRVRQDILTAVSYCATRVLSPDEDDLKKLERILSYLLYTKSQGMVLRIGPEIQLKAYVDASFGTYEDMKSVTGIVLMIGNATVYVKSGKQKIVTRSSTEAELVGLSDALSQILWTREFLCHQGLRLGPAIVYQDNQSTICLANKGRSTSERTRHVKVRYFFIKHYIDTNEIKIEYLPTGHMLADILTKPLHGALFLKFRTLITGIRL